MPRVKLEISSLIDLEPPPPVVEAAIWHWVQWLRFLPKAGPKVPSLCAGIERDYAHITRKLQAQYHDAEPDESQMFDWRTGESMERHINSLPSLRKQIIRGIHIHHTPITTLLWRLQIKEPRFHQELRSAYLSLAGKLCPSK